MGLFSRRTNAAVLFLDIDGVLAPFERRQDGMDTVLVGGWAGTMLVSPAVISRIRHLHSTGVVQVQWLTSWEDEAASCFAPCVGLGRYPVHVEPTTQPVDAARYWKEQVVRDHALTHPRFVWIDDEMTMHGSDVSVARDHPGALLLAPDPCVGLSVNDLDRVESFLGSTV